MAGKPACRPIMYAVPSVARSAGSSENDSMLRPQRGSRFTFKFGDMHVRLGRPRLNAARASSLIADEISRTSSASHVFPIFTGCGNPLLATWSTGGAM